MRNKTMLNFLRFYEFYKKEFFKKPNYYFTTKTIIKKYDFAKSSQTIALWKRLINKYYNGLEFDENLDMKLRFLFFVDYYQKEIINRPKYHFNATLIYKDYKFANSSKTIGDWKAVCDIYYRDYVNNK